MKLTKRLYTLSLTVTLFVTGFLLPGFSTSCTAQTETNSSPAYSCIEVPKSINFCGTEQGVPDDFKYLMVIESNVNPLARSGAGAAGLWQFMSGTAREFGLEVNHHVDERYHVEKSTVAACKYLKQAYRKFGNWETVAASYNAGQGRISQQQEKQYTDNALDLYLVEETSRYVYRILAAKLLLTDPTRFGFHLRASDLYPPIPYRTIKVTEDIDDLARFSKGQGINYSLLKSMNPWLRGSSLPNHGGKEYQIRIPDSTEMYYNPRVTHPHNPAWVSE